MSFDLTVYAKRELPADTIASLLGSVYGAQRSPGVQPIASGLVDAHGTRLLYQTEHGGVPLGANKEFPLELDGPSILGPEDLPGHIAKVAKGLRFSYRLGVPYGAPGNLAAQVERLSRFARELADAGKGVWVDEQSGEVWRGERRVAGEPKGSGDRIDLVEFNWYTAWDNVPADAMRIYVDACERHLPEALPLRYGSYEPPRQRIEDGIDALHETWAATTVLMGFRPISPCISGSFWAWEGSVVPDKVWSASLSANRRFLISPFWRARFQSLFLDLATRWECFYASAEVLRNWIWARGNIWGDTQEESGLSTEREGQWYGLPPDRRWWSYFGPSYIDLVAGQLSDECVTKTAHGLLYRISDEPLDIDALNAAGTQWTPDALTCRVLIRNPISIDTIAAARTIPAELGYPKDRISGP